MSDDFRENHKNVDANIGLRRFVQFFTSCEGLVAVTNSCVVTDGPLFEADLRSQSRNFWSGQQKAHRTPQGL